MLKESYLAVMKNLPKDAVKVVVTRTSGNILSPSWDLLNDYKQGRIDWNGYVKRFEEEMNNERCLKYMKEIKKISKERDVYLICYEKSGNCHRHILKKKIEELE